MLDDREVEEIVQANDAFAFDMYSQLKKENKNLFFSPLSISTCLILAYAGAKNKTKSEMTDLLHLNVAEERISSKGLSEDSLHSNYKILLDAIRSQDGQNNQKIKIANAIWIEKNLGLTPNYENLIRNNYGKEIYEINFSLPNVVDIINEWVSEKTNRKIQNILQSLGEDTLMVLANAIYFKANWQHKFDEKNTKNAPFTLITEEKIDVPMMYHEEQFYYLDYMKFELLGMFYQGGKMAMVILLPKTLDDLEAVEKSITVENTEKWFRLLTKQKVEVYLPKFKFTTTYQLNKILKTLGMNEAFTMEADFSRMTGEKPTRITNVIHKAFVDVNEEGTEAAAATIITKMLGAPLPRPKLVFRADHPFIFFIRDLRSKSILFMGRVMNPLK